ncbi:unnamed protein product, partial [Ectocarpus sp. 4 AP-2014]
HPASVPSLLSGLPSRSPWLPEAPTKAQKTKEAFGCHCFPSQPIPEIQPKAQRQAIERLRSLIVAACAPPARNGKKQTSRTLTRTSACHMRPGQWPQQTFGVYL